MQVGVGVAELEVVVVVVLQEVFEVDRVVGLDLTELLVEVHFEEEEGFIVLGVVLDAVGTLMVVLKACQP